MFVIMLGIAYNLWLQGYNYGKEGIQKLMGGDLLKKSCLVQKLWELWLLCNSEIMLN